MDNKNKIDQYCIDCGEKIADFDSIQKRWKSTPKRCEKCRKCRKEQAVVRTLIDTWDNVFFESCRMVNLTPNDLYWRAKFGGKSFGEKYNGAVYDRYFMIFIENDVPLVNGVPVGPLTVRLMSKEEGGEKSKYLVIEKGTSNGERRYIHYIEDWYKKSLDGRGKSLSKKTTINSQHEVIFKVATRSNSSASGNTCYLVISKDITLDVSIKSTLKEGKSENTSS